MLKISKVETIRSKAQPNILWVAFTHGLKRRGCQPVKGSMESIVLGDRLVMEVSEAAQGIPVGDALAQLTVVPVLDPIRVRARSVCCAVSPWRPVCGFWRPVARSRRTFSTSSACWSMKFEIACSTGSSRTFWLRNSRSAKLN
jgi:hypothetical protein